MTSGDAANGANHRSLSDELKSVTRHRIVAAAQALLPRRGLGITVDEVAEEAGVSARTIFRHFATRDQLLAAALADLRGQLGDLFVGPPPGATDLRGWLRAITAVIHRTIAERFGRSWWEIYTDPEDMAPELEREIQALRDYREAVAMTIGKDVWQAAGGTGLPPRWLADAFLVSVSAFGYFALAVSRDVTPEETGRVCGDMAWLALQQALREATPAEKPARRPSRSGG